MIEIDSRNCQLHLYESAVRYGGNRVLQITSAREPIKAIFINSRATFPFTLQSTISLSLHFDFSRKRSTRLVRNILPHRCQYGVVWCGVVWWYLNQIGFGLFEPHPNFHPRFYEIVLVEYMKQNQMLLVSTNTTNKKDTRFLYSHVFINDFV